MQVHHRVGRRAHQSINRRQIADKKMPAVWAGQGLSSGHARPSSGASRHLLPQGEGHKEGVATRLSR